MFELVVQSRTETNGWGGSVDIGPTSAIIAMFVTADEVGSVMHRVNVGTLIAGCDANARSVPSSADYRQRGRSGAYMNPRELIGGSNSFISSPESLFRTHISKASTAGSGTSA